jgi:bifunctional DNase/RNase
MVEMKVRGLAVDANTRQPVVILMDSTETRFLPIWIGVFEADAILVALEEFKAPRPASHDLMRSLIEQLGGTLERVVIHSLVEDKIGSTYYAHLNVRSATGAELEIDARPSDSIALALRLGAPVFVVEDVLARSSVQDKVKINKDMDEFKRFLAEVKPEDFDKYDRKKEPGEGGDEK